MVYETITDTKSLKEMRLKEHYYGMNILLLYYQL